MADRVAYNPEVRRKSYLKQREKYLQYSAEYSLKRKFNLSKEDYQKLLDIQQTVCAICGKTSKRALAVDHCHKTGKIRGLLCSKCNRGIGYLNDDPFLLKKTLEYLEYDVINKFN